MDWRRQRMLRRGPVEDVSHDKEKVVEMTNRMYSQVVTWFRTYEDTRSKELDEEYTLILSKQPKEKQDKTIKELNARKSQLAEASTFVNYLFQDNPSLREVIRDRLLVEIQQQGRPTRSETSKVMLTRWGWMEMLQFFVGTNT